MLTLSTYYITTDNNLWPVIKCKQSLDENERITILF